MYGTMAGVSMMNATNAHTELHSGYRVAGSTRKALLPPSYRRQLVNNWGFTGMFGRGVGWRLMQTLTKIDNAGD
jgi:hypothetical protein